MASVGMKIRKLVKELERDAAAATELREWAKHEVKLSPFGVALLEAAWANDIPQAVVARALDINPAAVSKRYTALSS